jgi:quercetin dioxygenase-like cupin family protein
VFRVGYAEPAMRIFRAADAPPVPTDEKSFTGRVHSRRLASYEATPPVRVFRVEFDAAARTRWHKHTGPQWLFIIDGHVRLQKWGEPAQDISSGDAAVIEPGEKHWHGAAPGARGTHIAVNVDATTEWLEPVSDEQYGSSSI